MNGQLPRHRQLKPSHSARLALSVARSSLVHLPEGYLNYLFRNETGMSVHRFVMDVRMQQAGDALRTTDRRYEQIGLQSGFRNPEYFLRAFKGYFGMHPDEYRAEKRRLPANENI